MIRGRISSDIGNLNELNKIYSWIPNETQIRPTPETIIEKLAHTDYVFDKWVNFKHYILDTVFHYSTKLITGHLCVPEVLRCEWAFVKSEFPYDVRSDVHHWVLWNSFYDLSMNFDEKQINQMLEDILSEIVESEDFDFAWYINPKPSIPELWHCQVFWIRLS